MKKLLTLLLALFTFAFSVFVSACSIENRDPNGSFGIESSGGDPSKEEEDAPSGEAYTVTLQPPVGEALETAEGLYAVWTEKNGINVYRAPFNKEGVATSYEPDGEYQVTLSATPEGFTYNPNIYTANNDDNETVIELYPLRDFSGGNGNKFDTPFNVPTGGAYRFTFNQAGEEYYFVFGSPKNGTVHFRSLLDVTKDEVLPIFCDYGVPQVGILRKQIIGGGEENSYTKNFYTTYALTDSQELLYKMSVETTNPNAYPIVVDMLIEITEYKDDYTDLEKVAVPDIKLPTNRKKSGSDPWVAGKPNGNFVLLADAVLTNSNYLTRIPFNENMVKKVKNEETGVSYYYLNEEYWNETYPNHRISSPGKKMLYVRLAKDIPGIINSTDLAGAHDLGLSYRTEILCPLPNGKGKDYSDFFAAYLARKNSAGDYPVDEYMMQFLEDYSISHKIFYDGYGNAEGMVDSKYVYAASSGGRWLFACGYYTQDNKG